MQGEEGRVRSCHGPRMKQPRRRGGRRQTHKQDDAIEGGDHGREEHRDGGNVEAADHAVLHGPEGGRMRERQRAEEDVLFRSGAGCGSAIRASKTIDTAWAWRRQARRTARTRTMGPWMRRALEVTARMMCGIQKRKTPK